MPVQGQAVLNISVNAYAYYGETQPSVLKTVQVWFVSHILQSKVSGLIFHNVFEFKTVACMFSAPEKVINL